MGGGGSCLTYWSRGGVLISEHGVPLLQGNTVMDHSLRLEDADIPIIAAMKS